MGHLESYFGLGMDPAISRNLELWSFYLGFSILIFLVLLRLYRRQ
jgi:hypothetical protein